MIRERIAGALDSVANWLRRPSRHETQRRQALADLAGIFPRHLPRIIRAMVDGTSSAAVHAEVQAVELVEIRCALESIRRTSAQRHAALRQTLTEART